VTDSINLLLGTSGKVSCLVDSATTYTILRKQRYFSNLIPNHTRLKTISGLLNLIEGHEAARLLCQMILNLPLNRPYSHLIPEECH